jgi:hypothetical protein
MRGFDRQDMRSAMASTPRPVYGALENAPGVEA